MDLKQFIIKAKANGWVGALKGGEKINASRRGSEDIIYNVGDFHYHDSFVGFSDFCGREHVTHKSDDSSVYRPQNDRNKIKFLRIRFVISD